MADGAIRGLKGRMSGYYRETDGIAGPLEIKRRKKEDSTTSARYEFITEQILRAYHSKCDVQVCHETPSGPQTVVSLFVAAYCQ